ncbi:unnamed protein product, partial [Mesorhabditis belari]|uniref:Uncharacterized protein n=1 Tax=Mesorhabditis belari TaxID=2138241 RepID=A0AAF3FLK0_9BILA
MPWLGTVRTESTVFDLKCIGNQNGQSVEEFIGCKAKDMLRNLRHVKIGTRLLREQLEPTGVSSDKGFIFLCNKTNNMAVWEPVGCWALSGANVSHFNFGQKKEIKDMTGKKNRNITCEMIGKNAHVFASQLI